MQLKKNNNKMLSLLKILKTRQDAFFFYFCILHVCITNAVFKLFQIMVTSQKKKLNKSPFLFKK